MLEQAMLREQVQELLSREQDAVQTYENLASRIEDPALKEQVLQLYREKVRHIRLTERLLELLD